MIDPIKCPGCGGEEFEIHKYGAMWREGNFISVDPHKQFYSCINCGYIIRTAEDLNMLTVKVYIVGNSMAKHRHGLREVERIVGRTWNLSSSVILAGLEEDGCLNVLPETPSGLWLFTVDAWKKFKTNPTFALCDESHTIEEVSLV